ncbi:methyltransferase domain-containing protein [Prosthecobacter sp. SYSU 5D2]|uniref:class I SAM-dependent methyltransferase n=1 Tax=Prosthecobacter sp. SYSU 5D2 TaxID=3134134 RepID=UPI0031FF14BD
MREKTCHVTDNPMEGRLLPPSSFLKRLYFYGSRYGYVHAVLSYIGRHSFLFWSLVGPWVTRKYLKQWLVSGNVHIVNLGGGSVLHERWLTADIDPRSDVWADLTGQLPFPPNSIDVFYLEEVIEHISKEQGEALLSRCFQALMPGGWIRITTPSLDYFIEQVRSKPDDTKPINDIFYLHDHRHIYSENELESLIRKTGFSEVIPSSYRDKNSNFGGFDTHPIRFPMAVPECSQYWEAKKE